MQHPTHPDDERLAALAGGDPEVASDGALSVHVDTCDRCARTVRELGSLRAALAELPDLVPSRPLQLLPPVAEPRPARGSWLRRLAGPAMAAGFVLVVVGAVGSSGFSLQLGASAGAAPSYFQGEAAGEDSEQPALLGPTTRATSGVTVDGSSVSGNPLAGGQRSTNQESVSSPKGQDAAPPSERGGTTGLLSTTDPRLPWLVVLGLGVGLLLAGIYLRFAQQPRAG